MKGWLKTTLSIIGIILTLVLMISAVYYTPDIPAETLRERYEYDDSQWVTVDGVDIHYRSVGEGPAMILVHGFSGNLRNWDKWISILSKDYNVIAYDLPGFGLTGPIASRDYTDGRQVAFLHDFKNAIGIDTFILAGNSMGGAIAWQYALTHPDDVTDLILVDASGYKSVREDLGSKSTPLGFKLLRYPILKVAMTKVTPAFVIKKSLRDTYGDPDFITDEDVKVVRDIMRYPGGREALFDRMNNGVSPPTERISDITIPTLILWGDRDNLIPYSHAAKFEADIDGAKSIIYPGIGHLPMDEHAEVSAGDVVSWLSGN